MMIFNCFHSFARENKLKLHKSVCEKKDFCNIIMSFEDIKILEFNQYQESDKASFLIYADLKCILEKTDQCKNHHENLSTTKANKHIPSGFATSTIFSFRSKENKHVVYRGKDCMKKFCEFLREQAMKIINF